MAVKYVFVTGGVVSGLGKGITAASLGRLLKARGYQVTMQKFDPYINMDPGTMNPIQHGEVFVTDDGTETDLDLGHYERFIDENLDKNSNVTTGKIYWSVLQKERHGDFGGGTVQVIPHITNEIKSRFYKGKPAEEDRIAIIEVGGTAGDIESQPFLEAIRQFQHEKGSDHVCLIHVTLIPYLRASGEMKTKPTQASVKQLQGMGIQPDILVCRSEYPLDEELRAKIALFCNVPVTHVLQNPDVEYLYEVPLVMEREKLADVVLETLRLENRKPDLRDWEAMVSNLKNPDKTVTIAMVGKYTQLHDAYLSVVEALKHGGIYSRAKVEITWVDSEELNERNLDQTLHHVDGILVPGGFGNRGTEGMILAAHYARTNKIPYLGICLGMQMAIVEFARNVLGYADANSLELNPETTHPVIALMPDQEHVEDLGGTLRLGSYPCILSEGSRSLELFGKKEIEERHRHRYEVNNAFRAELSEKGMCIAGTSPDNRIVEMIEVKDHPFYIGTQGHPEFKSRPNHPHPLFRGFIQAALKKYPGLYRPEFEHDNCGIGAVVNIQGKKSHETVVNALKIVENLEHRAGKDAEGKTGDGVGILLQISHRFFKKACQDEGIPLGEEREYGIAQLFFPQHEIKRAQAKKMFEVILEKEGLKLLGWRTVPVFSEVLGSRAKSCMPVIMQAFIAKTSDCEKGLEFDRKLYVARREFEQSNDNTYVVSMSSRTIVYKGMFLVGQLRTFFADLQNPDYESAIAMVHSRFSTNTNPSWERAHPNRLIVHNGEINTIRGNADKMLAREENMESPYLKDQLHKVLPVVNRNGSDSAMLDNTLEFLVMSGMDLPLAVMITIPEPWANNDTISQEERDFYQYYATMMEPWDGPASILFSDGDVMGAVLDRNGLRPSRYYVTSDGYVILSSEVGVLPVPEEKIILKERIHPGKMLLVDTVKGEIVQDQKLKDHYANMQPYGEWLNSNLVHLHDIPIPNLRVEEYTGEQRARLQKTFGYTYEQYRTSIRNMALNGIESIASMGVDTPLAVLSKEPRPLFDYFKQIFAQVTNPPIDSIREEIVTSTSVYVGKDGNLLTQQPENCQVLKIEHPILTNTDMLKIKHMKNEHFRVAVVSTLYYKSTKLERAIDRLFVEVDKAYREGANILVLSDRGVDENHMPIPSLLAVSAVHQHLVKTKKSTSLAIILESGEPREVHHFATLLGYGASAVNPWLALDTIRELIDNHMLDKDYYAAVEDYNHAVLGGIVKIASKMGISTIQSYQGAQIFEAIGISSDVINKYFTGTVSRVEGITLDDIDHLVDRLHSEAFDPLGLAADLTLDSIGAHKMRAQGEEHRYNPRTIHTLQQAARTGDYTLFKSYTKMVDEETHGTLRSLLEFQYPDQPVPIEEVESVEEIVKRFKTGAMSYGSISQEAHETLAIAMNHLHGKSNTGEGGESEERLDSAGGPDSRCSAIKQVASARFGVTSRYLVSAREIQIKMAQGAKPGEGGHLPAKKVYPWIAKTRHSTPGVSLISPPPHHDIYSIEDLAQLIYDLKNANKYADISVKLVSEAGVGTVAAGVAKAGAQTILISGYDGGTGAAPKSSIHHAGLPWELGLAETHQTLLMNGLRSRVRIETDGKLMSGRDVAIAALLGAEEFGFATAPLVTMGCVMMRVCNLDTCPVGVATQNPELRKRFRGKPEYVENFMHFIAQELREYMAKLGVRSIDEMVGRTDLLRASAHGKESHNVGINLTAILQNPYAKDKEKVIFDPSCVYNFELEKTLDEQVLLKKCGESIRTGKKTSVDVQVSNVNRTVGTLLGAEITRQHKDGLPDDTITVHCTGAGGQSFGAFIPKGLTLYLTGDSNDYFGKGLSGGKLIVKTPQNAGYRAEENVIIGNVALYGATSGSAFINGIAGERFAVRNSGANAVVEGVGEHGCEYMTGGRVVVLGRTGKNFAAGMSGGIAYVLDLDNKLYKNVNKTMISIEKVENKYDKKELRELIEAHVESTKSELGKKILEDFDGYLVHFKKLIPDEYKRMLALSAKLEEKGLTGEQAQMEAFYESVGEKSGE